MRHFASQMLVMVVTALALIAPAALADPPTPKGEGKPVFTYIIDFVPITYWDAEYLYYGPGKLQLLHVGNDPNNDTVLIKAELTQGGKKYVGSGVLVDKKVIFSVGPYFFQLDVPGWGSYHLAGHPEKLYWVYTETPGL